MAGKERPPFVPFDPKSIEPFALSRTKVELFTRCPRCFYLSQRYGISIPGGAPFGLNIRVDGLLKKDLDLCRLSQKPIPRAKRFDIHAVPFNHPDIKHWLNVFNDIGLRYHHTETNLIIYGAPDDIWVITHQNWHYYLSIVDFKATHSNSPITKSYFWEENKRQVDLYSWMLSKQKLHIPVSKISIFVRINTDKKQESFNRNTLEFEDEIYQHHGSYDWIEPTLKAIKECLMSDRLPEPNKNCTWCQYRSKTSSIESTTIEN